MTEKAAAITRAEAILRKAETNLGYTTIKSPIRGVIVDRRVNIGQTVVSNLNAPSLFLIATDLRRIEVWASVNEADIGSIRIGMPVQFTVDAYRNERFDGAVKQIRLNATMAQSVVTYTVVASVDNSTGKLLLESKLVTCMVKLMPSAIMTDQRRLSLQNHESDRSSSRKQDSDGERVIRWVMCDRRPMVTKLRIQDHDADSSPAANDSLRACSLVGDSTEPGRGLDSIPRPERRGDQCRYERAAHLERHRELALEG